MITETYIELINLMKNEYNNPPKNKKRIRKNNNNNNNSKNGNKNKSKGWSLSKNVNILKYYFI